MKNIATFLSPLIGRVEELKLGLATNAEISVEPPPGGTEIDSSIIREVHLTPKKDVEVLRIHGSQYGNDVLAHRLNDKDMPELKIGLLDKTERIEQIYKIVDYLNVDDEKYLRYKKTSKDTRCNIYAYDFCCLANVYIPGVWWTPMAIDKLIKKEAVEEKFWNRKSEIETGKLDTRTIGQLRANNLYKWFQYYSALYGWHEVATIEELQRKANESHICIIIGQNKIWKYSGHISIVLPEYEVKDKKISHKAYWKNENELLQPILSQAGDSNYKYYDYELCKKIEKENENKAAKDKKNPFFNWWKFPSFQDNSDPKKKVKLYRFYYHDLYGLEL